MFPGIFSTKTKLKSKIHFRLQSATLVLIISLLITGFVVWKSSQDHSLEREKLNDQIVVLSGQLDNLKTVEASLSAELTELKNENPRKTNAELQLKIAQVETTFKLASQTLENISSARYQSINVSALEEDLADAVNLLSQLKYDEANTALSEINKHVEEQIAAKQVQVAQSATPTQDLPSSGSYRRQSVVTSRGTFTVSLIAEETSSVRMITDTANDDTCTDNCPVLSLANYVSRNSGFAGINGTYFCPPDYPSCAGKVNSYNTLVFNSRLKKYMNSDQNVYSVNPMLVQNADRSLRFMGQALEWGRDTGIIGGLSNYPMLVNSGQAQVSDSGAKGPRGFIGVKGGTLYIGVIHGADFGDAAAVLVTLGLNTAINLDGGGSSVLYYNGKYVVGPGRNLPNAVVLAR